MTNRSTLGEVLERSRSLGFLGPGTVESHLAHAQGFVQLAATAERLLDLGSGGGVPGLVIAVSVPDVHITLLDANERRVAFLRSAVRELGVEERVTVELGRAENLAWTPHLRGRFDMVVARSFGAPAVTAECAAGFLEQGGRLLVSEPEHLPDRWPAEGVAAVGLRLGEVHEFEASNVRELVCVTPGLEDVPRAVGVPGRKPRF
ncbi:MAG: RsmG family class I SAM-dependent methyltransferase [Acidimicrobiales bacterium]